MDAEIGVIGVGTMGSMAMWQLARKGVSVVGFEQYGVGHDRSAAGGETRVFRTAYKEGSQYVPILKLANQLWKELEQESGNKLFNLNKGLAIGDPNSVSMKNIMKSIEEHDLKCEILTQKEASIRYPQHKLLDNEIMIVDHEAGFLHAQLAIVAAVNRAEEEGAIVHRQTRVEEVEHISDGVRVRANGKDYKFKQVFITTGPWVKEFLPDYEDHIEIRRLVNTWFAPKDIYKYIPENFPVFLREKGNSSYYGFPTVDGSMLKIALGSTKEDKIESPNNLNRTVELEKLESIRKIVETDLPDLYPDPVRVNAYMEAYTSDGHPIVGRLHEKNNIVVACGFSGHGFKMASAIGKIISDILLDDKTDLPIKHLSPNRFITVR